MLVEALCCLILIIIIILNIFLNILLTLIILCSKLFCVDQVIF